MNKRFYRCSCFVRSNIYLEQIRAHVHYTNDEQFREQYRHLCTEKFDMTEMLKSVKNEINRRENLQVEARQRKEQIQREFRPSDPEIYRFKREFLAEEFRDISSKSTRNHRAVKNFSNGIFSFPVFTEDFCRRFVRELKHFQNSSMPKAQPNTMNKYGILLEEIGMTNFIDEFRLDFLDPLARTFFGNEFLGQSGLDSHRAFIVSYKISKDVELDYHYDNAEITLNVCLGDVFHDGDLYFGTMAKANRRTFANFTFVEQRPGYGVFHRGQHLHGAQPISSGERMNLVIWMRSSSIRNELCPMCWKKPDELIDVEDDSYGDGMTRSLPVNDSISTTDAMAKRE